jgi:hypothetical protein
VLNGELPHFIKNSVAAYVGCVAGAVEEEEYLEAMRKAGFQEIKVLEKTSFPTDHLLRDPTIISMAESLKLTEEQISEAAKAVWSIRVEAFKPLVLPPRGETRL